MASTKKDTYGNTIDESVPEWRSLQQRNKDIENAGKRILQAKKHLCKDVVFFSEGVRCRGTLWAPKTSLPGKPAILLCHGWGGLRAFLDIRYANKFVDEGFICLTFDYRGWGSSDGMLVPVYDGDIDSGNAILSLQESARQQDNDGQTPIVSAQLKVGKIGIFGSSVGGGHVLTYGARDPSLVACIVSQVPSVGRHGAGDVNNLGDLITSHRHRMAREGWIPAGSREFHLTSMDGSPILRKLQWYDPLLYCTQIHVPTLVIDVEKEELWDVNMNGKAAFDSIPSKDKEYYVLKGYQHYDAYKSAADEARKVTVSFFKKHLVTRSSM